MQKQISDLNKRICELEIFKSKIEEKMRVGGKKDNSLKRDFDSFSETIDDLLQENWHLENPDKTIVDVLEVTYEVIPKIVPILLRIFDSIRSRQSDASVSPDLNEYIYELEEYAPHPSEWSKLLAMLQLPKESESDSDDEIWKYKLSWLHVIFFQDKINSDYLSDFGVLMAIALRNCDEHRSMLNNEKDDDVLIRDFFSKCQHLDMISILQKFPILFFKALDHPTIRSHFLENPDLKTKHHVYENLHVHLSKICSFFEYYHSGLDFTAHELNQRIFDLEMVCYILDV